MVVDAPQPTVSAIRAVRWSEKNPRPWNASEFVVCGGELIRDRIDRR